MTLLGTPTARTVPVGMTDEEARAARIRELKDARPDLTWREIGYGVGVTEKNAWLWSKTGKINYVNAKKLAEFLGVDLDWLWTGQEGRPPTLTVIDSDPDRLEQILTELRRSSTERAEMLQLLNRHAELIGRQEDVLDRIHAHLRLLEPMTRILVELLEGGEGRDARRRRTGDEQPGA